jgi:hypothetical protein
MQIFNTPTTHRKESIMNKQDSFNTGRNYGTEQIIEYTILQEIDSGFAGSLDVLVSFEDKSRGIKGQVMVYMIYDVYGLRSQLLNAYDSGDYTSI